MFRARVQIGISDLGIDDVLIGFQSLLQPAVVIRSDLGPRAHIGRKRRGRRAGVVEQRNGVGPRADVHRRCRLGGVRIGFVVDAQCYPLAVCLELRIRSRSGYERNAPTPGGEL